MRLGLAIVVVLALNSASALAAPLPDRVIAEDHGVLDVATDGSTVAWSRLTSATQVQLVIHNGRKVVRRIKAGRIGDFPAAPVDIGRAQTGRKLIAYLQCAGDRNCDIRIVGASGRSSKRLLRVKQRPNDLAVARGRVFWSTSYFDGRRPDDVRSVLVTGGAPRIEARLPKREIEDLAVTPTTIYATASISKDSGGGSNSDPDVTSYVMATRGGSAWSTLTSSRSSFFSELVLAGRAVAALVDGGSSIAVLTGGRRKLRASGLSIQRWDATGARAVFADSDLRESCLGTTVPEGSEEGTVTAPCRIVVANNWRGERLLPPQLNLAGRIATLARPVLLGGRVVRRIPQANVTVTVTDGSRAVLATLTTDARGQVELPPAEFANAHLLTAATKPFATYAQHETFNSG